MSNSSEICPNLLGQFGQSGLSQSGCSHFQLYQILMVNIHFFKEHERLAIVLDLHVVQAGPDRQSTEAIEGGVGRKYCQKLKLSVVNLRLKYRFFYVSKILILPS